MSEHLASVVILEQRALCIFWPGSQFMIFRDGEVSIWEKRAIANDCKACGKFLPRHRTHRCSYAQVAEAQPSDGVNIGYMFNVDILDLDKICVEFILTLICVALKTYMIYSSPIDDFFAG
jgi:hypothetical protein